jgi:hypothetical protein
MRRRARGMSDYVTNVKLAEINKSVSEIKKDLDELKSTLKSNDDLWDNSDIVKNWHVSIRTLADWRKKDLIGYVQINKKIYYPKHLREIFLNDNSNRKGGSIG